MTNADRCKRAIIIFLRYPIPGMVKARLALSVGNEKAAILYKQMVECVVATVYKIERANILFFIDEKKYVNECDEWLGTQGNIHIQVQGDIGRRMTNAFNCVFTDGYEHVLLLGTDIPSLTDLIVNKGFEELEHHDSVLGGTLDGGYYLIGLKSPADFLFTNMLWSTNSVFLETRRRLQENNMTCSLLPELRDIDTLEDLEHEGFGHYSRFE